MERLEILEREIKVLVFDQNGTIVDMQKGLRACPGPKRNLGLRLSQSLEPENWPMLGRLVMRLTTSPSWMMSRELTRLGNAR